VRPLIRGLPDFPGEHDAASQHADGPTGAGNYPPAYYVLGAVAYALPGLDNATARLYAIRVVSALLGGLAAIVIFRLLLAAGVPELLSVLGMAAIVQLPMLTQSSATVNPDILLVVAFSGLTASLLRAREDMTRRRLLFVVLWGLLAALTKPIGGPAALVITIAMLGLSPVRNSWKRRAAVGAALGATLVGAGLHGVPAGVRVSSAARYGFSYLWQFYLPKLPHQTPGIYASSHKLASWSVWIETGVGKFGWLTTPMPQWAYRLAFWSLVIATLAAIAGFLLTRAERREAHAAGALVIAALAYVLLLHIAEVVLLLGHSPLLLQGRYFIPIVPVFGAALYLGLARLGRVGVGVAGALVAITFVLSLQGLNDVMVYFG
jgi:hypothetical protein